jgi:hypothetical protein
VLVTVRKVDAAEKLVAGLAEVTLDLLVGSRLC